MEYLINYPDLVKLYELNTPKIQREIINKINKPPSISDCAGFVYGFTKCKDKNTRSDFFIKLGRTKRNPDIRIGEWNGEQVFSIKSIYSKKFERLVHLFFKFANVHKNNMNNPSNKEIEWFKFKKENNINKHWIIAKVNDINSLIDDLYPEDENSKSPNNASLINIDLTNLNLITVNEFPNDLINSDSKLNINDCSKKDLMKIKGIGKTLSEKIIKYRPYVNFDQIYNLSGIGKNKIDLIKNRCSL